MSIVTFNGSTLVIVKANVSAATVALSRYAVLHRTLFDTDTFSQAVYIYLRLWQSIVFSVRPLIPVWRRF